VNTYCVAIAAAKISINLAITAILSGEGIVDSANDPETHPCNGIKMKIEDSRVRIQMLEEPTTNKATIVCKFCQQGFDCICYSGVAARYGSITKQGVLTWLETSTTTHIPSST